MTKQNIIEKYLTFIIDKEIYGLEILKVREIVAMMHISKIPLVPPYVKGVINLRGEVTPIIDLRVRFNIIDKPFYSSETIVIAVKTSDSRMLGLVVDEVSDVENIDTENLLPSPMMGTSISNEYLRGLVKKLDKMIVLMDIDKILDKKEIDNYII